MLFYLTEAILLRELAAEHRSDHVRVHFGTNGAVIARLARRLGSPPFSIAYHGPDEFDAPERWDIAGVVNDCAFVTAISAFCASQIMRWSSTENWAKIHIVRCSVEADDLTTDIECLPKDFRLCVVGRLAPQKGLRLLLQAIANLSARGTTLPVDVVGDGPEGLELRQFVEKMGVSDLVTFHGSLDGKSVRQIIKRSSVFVLPSFAEGLPVVLMEAMALGRPVITTYIAGVPELVESEVNGWLCVAGDVDDLARALQDAAQTPRGRLGEMGALGRKRVAECHDPRREGQTLYKIIQTLAHG